MVLVANAVVLHHRAGWPDGPDGAPAGGGGPVAGGDPGLRSLGSWLVAWAAVVLFLGTVVTGSGPHAGSNEGQYVERLPFVVRDVARLHAVAVWILLALALSSVWRAYRDRAPADVLARGGVLLAVLCAQGAIGYLQYFTNVPAPLVAVHIAGATALWVAVLRFRLGLVSPTVPAPTPRAHPAGAPVPHRA
jgi:cytochrome c oxidase assembly protein subunit 15